MKPSSGSRELTHHSPSPAAPKLVLRMGLNKPEPFHQDLGGKPEALVQPAQCFWSVWIKWIWKPRHRVSHPQLTAVILLYKSGIVGVPVFSPEFLSRLGELYLFCFVFRRINSFINLKTHIGKSTSMWKEKGSRVKNPEDFSAKYI